MEGELRSGVDVASVGGVVFEDEVSATLVEETSLLRVGEKRLKEKFGSSVVVFACGAAVVIVIWEVVVITMVDLFPHDVDRVGMV